MRKIIIAALCTAFLAGCGKTAQDIAVDIKTTTQSVHAKAKAAQEYAVDLCGYLPYLSAVTAMFNAQAGSSVSAIGTAVCNAVTTLPLAEGPGDRIPRVNGVVVKGRFVR